MLSKHASLSIKVVTTIFNTDCANPSIFQADLFVYTVCNRFGVLRYGDIYPFCPFWTEVGYCCPLYILCMMGIKTPVSLLFNFHHTSVFSSRLGKILWTEMSFVVWTEDLFISLMISWKHKCSSVHPVCIKEVWFMPQEINSRWDVRTENIRQPFWWYCEH